MRVNVGCGSSPIEGWRNFDNSPSLLLAKIPGAGSLLGGVGLLSGPQREYIRFASETRIEYADVRERIPVPDGSVDVLYSSHMLEHIDREDAKAFLREGLRVLRPGGILRLAVPDLMFYAKRYAEDGDLEYFMYHTHMTRPRLRGLGKKLSWLVTGDRHHQWMYDARHLCGVLREVGYRDPQSLAAGETGIAEPGGLNLSERAPESLYVEALR